MAKVRAYALCSKTDRIGSSFPVVAYITSYISKLDKFSKVGWRDVMHELKSQLVTSAEMHKGM